MSTYDIIAIIIAILGGLAAIGGVYYGTRNSVSSSFKDLVGALHTDNAQLRQAIGRSMDQIAAAEKARLEAETQRLELLREIVQLREKLTQYIETNAMLTAELEKVKTELAQYRIEYQKLAVELSQMSVALRHAGKDANESSSPPTQ